MGKIKRYIDNMSLRKSIVFYIVLFMFVAIMMYMGTASLCQILVNNIYEKYPPAGEKYYLTNENGERLGEGTYISKEVIPMSKRDEILIDLLEVFPIIVVPVYTALCILAATMIFYQRKIKKPLLILQNASEKIFHNDLDFEIKYANQDELGKLCNSFEIMRSELKKNFSEMWRQTEQRKRLNAAFAHDLRTPLTVIKGYNEMLQVGNEPEARNTADTMVKHIIRMEQYVDTMSNLQRLEELQPECQCVKVQDFVETMQDAAQILCEKENIQFVFHSEMLLEKIAVDPKIIVQVYQNLISNAIRYAASYVEVNLKDKETGLELIVIDDGKGFSEKCLKNAMEPYFTEEQGQENHLGIGLYICKILCQHHAGSLSLQNGNKGACVTAFFEYLA